MDSVVFCGIQGSGKSTYYRRFFSTTHVRINLDTLRTRRREEILVKECIDERRPFVVDNTNPAARDRRRYVDAARGTGITLAAYYFGVTPKQALDRNRERPPHERIPAPAIYATHRRLEVPTTAEGFARVYRVRSTAPDGFTVELIDERRERVSGHPRRR